jgi:uncharacterized membrane protein YoaK (UPF0700 family)
MPLDYARRLTGRDRTPQANRQLGIALAFVAGATNAGAFLAVRQYTSHMTGLVSAMADDLVLGHMPLVLSALGGLLSFVSGAATTAVLVNMARRRSLHSQYALPLLLEALWMLLFGLMGSQLAEIGESFVPATVVVLCFMMGLQNALISKISNSEIRTTHLTGMVTDIGIELGKLLYWNHLPESVSSPVRANLNRLGTLSALVASFFVGGLTGTLGFKLLGYAMTLPLALLLASLTLVPAADDLRQRLNRTHRGHST